MVNYMPYISHEKCPVTQPVAKRGIGNVLYIVFTIHIIEIEVSSHLQTFHARNRDQCEQLRNNIGTLGWSITVAPLSWLPAVYRGR